MSQNKSYLARGEGDRGQMSHSVGGARQESDGRRDQQHQRFDQWTPRVPPFPPRPVPHRMLPAGSSCMQQEAIMYCCVALL